MSLVSATTLIWPDCLFQPALSPAVGGIIGFSLVFGGGDAVVWYAPAKEFPYIAGIVPVVISWFLSPLLAALITLVLFLLIRTLVLRRANSTKIAFWVLPVLILLTFFINLFFILVSDGGFTGMRYELVLCRAAAASSRVE
jgi:phosphate/sulfate permease